jgi:hypothetical protein
MSLGHSIECNGKMIQAKYFLNRSKKIYKIESHGECLYNILMNKYQTVQANNLTVETLHPNNKIAQKILNKNKRSEILYS